MNTLNATIALTIVASVSALAICGLCERRLSDLRHENARLNMLLDDRQKEIAQLQEALAESSCDAFFHDARRMCCEMQLAHLSTCEP